jgi:hypothetical protein
MLPCPDYNATTTVPCHFIKGAVLLPTAVFILLLQDHLADPYHVTFTTNGVSVPFINN